MAYRDMKKSLKKEGRRSTKMYGTKMGYVRKDFENVFKQRCFNKYNGITNVSIEKYQCLFKRGGRRNLTRDDNKGAYRCHLSEVKNSDFWILQSLCSFSVTAMTIV